MKNECNESDNDGKLSQTEFLVQMKISFLWAPENRFAAQVGSGFSECGPRIFCISGSPCKEAIPEAYPRLTKSISKKNPNNMQF